MVNLPAAWPLMEPGLKWNFFFVGWGEEGGLPLPNPQLGGLSFNVWKTFAIS